MKKGRNVDTSTRDTVGSDTYSYWFREMGHIPEDETEIVQIPNDIAGWIGE